MNESGKSCESYVPEEPVTEMIGLDEAFGMAFEEIEEVSRTRNEIQCSTDEMEKKISHVLPKEYVALKQPTAEMAPEEPVTDCVMAGAIVNLARTLRGARRLLEETSFELISMKNAIVKGAGE